MHLKKGKEIKPEEWIKTFKGNELIIDACGGTLAKLRFFLTCLEAAISG